MLWIPSMYFAPANWLGPVGKVVSSPTESRLPVAGSALRTYFVNRLRSLSDVLVPPGLAKFPEIVEFAAELIERQT